MTPEALHIRSDVAHAESQLRNARSALANLEARCSHVWGRVVSDPIIRKGYTEPGDVPGTMGIDFRPSFYVPEQVTPRWTRTCTVCGKVEETTATDKQVSLTPKF